MPARTLVVEIEHRLISLTNIRPSLVILDIFPVITKGENIRRMQKKKKQWYILLANTQKEKDEALLKNLRDLLQNTAFEKPLV